MTEQEMQKELKIGSAQIRLETLKMLKWRGYGHLGGAMSIVELLSVLYNKVLRYDPKNPDWKDRDYVVLSKGHSDRLFMLHFLYMDFLRKTGCIH